MRPRKADSLAKACLMCLTLVAAFGCGGSGSGIGGHYRAHPLFGAAITDREALSLLATMRLTLDPSHEFVWKAGSDTISGTWEISGRFLTLHLQNVGEEPASRTRGSENSVLAQSYEIFDNGSKLAYVNAEPGTPAIEFVRQAE